MIYNGHGFGVTAAQPPLEGPFGGALKKVYVAVTSGHISHGCLAGAQWAALGEGWVGVWYMCGMRNGWPQVALCGSLTCMADRGRWLLARIY